MKKQKKYSPVNKGHSFDLETKERLDAFKQKLSFGWEKNMQNTENFGKNYPLIA